jgi:ATP-dependent exoDNAse (exonuclease V) beta subunit
VVIPINTATILRSREQFVYRSADDTLHWVIGDVVPPDLLSALDSDDESLMRERERLWYVACTRARELLIVPELPQANMRSWARIVDMRHTNLPRLDLSRMIPTSLPGSVDPPNTQTAEIFAAERALIDEVATPLTWVRPSNHDPDRIPVIEATGLEPADAPEVEIPVGAGRVRGLLLHKLMEEVLTGELSDRVPTLAARAGELIVQLVPYVSEETVVPDTNEIASTVRRTLELPDVAAIRPRLVPEWPIYTLLEDTAELGALCGRIDAIAYENGRPVVVVDWKSDVRPGENDVRAHLTQLEDYLRATGAMRGAIVYMTSGRIEWMESVSPSGFRRA